MIRASALDQADVRLVLPKSSLIGKPQLRATAAAMIAFCTAKGTRPSNVEGSEETSTMRTL